NQECLDFDSVQRANAEMERRAQEVIDRCWQLGEDNPILSIHDVGAGGLSNALPELAHTGGVGAIFKLRAIPNEEAGMSPLQIWCNEAQERYVLAIDANSLTMLQAICERERCPFAVLGAGTNERHLRVEDDHFNNNPVDIGLDVILGKAPKMLRDVKRQKPNLAPPDLDDIDLIGAGYRILAVPSVADKTFLITIGDRTVGGLTTRDQMVGAWQTPVADVAVTLAGFKETSGEAYAIGERTPMAAIDAPASGRMAVGEALTNLAAALIWDLGEVKLSANWMAAAGHPGEDAALFDTVKAVAMELCPELGISIPVGKDSLSMKTLWRDEQSGENKSVIAPLSLIVSAFAPCSDVRQTLTPVLRTDVGDTLLMLVDLGQGKCRLGGSALLQAYNQVGNVAPDVDDPRMLKALFQCVQRLNQEGLLLAYHDRSDGGLFAAVCEMMFASHSGVTLWMDRFFDEHVLGDGSQSFDDRSHLLHLLFNEELGAVFQIKREDSPKVMRYLNEAMLANKAHVIGTLNGDDALVMYGVNGTVFDEPRMSLQSAWSRTSFQMQRLRDNPQCAEQEFTAILDAGDPGLHVQLNYDVNEDIAAPFMIGKARPPIAILREQGVNGQLEMATAFDRAGFVAVDVHMSDIIAGRASLKDFIGLAACGGFSYGDVLGAGEGWAKSILFNARARSEFEAFFQRQETFALGVCNGCQMMSNLREIIPGAASWPHFARNLSEQYEARFVMVEVQNSPSILLQGMAGSRMPIVVSHGEGRAEFADAKQHVSLRFVDHYGAMANTYPRNPNGSPQGIAGLTTDDGRFTIMMPHPERVFRALQNSWRPREWNEDGAWMRVFRNARKWVG
ncbi:MAG: phosphoribosylformylglycinamidine synthase, partial [Pseudomonadota bacterium]|nr:phosphoribosylformylglycinamidine synthase [Pseudomonadota bacterium]